MAGGAAVSAGDGDGAPDGRAVCAGCGCVCDDLPLEGPPYAQGRPNVDTDCERGRRWLARRVFGPALGDRRPAVGGSPASASEAAARAAELLEGARRPRVAGLERLPLAAQRKLVEIADRTGADVDASAAPGHLDSVLAVQRDGGSFLTLGEVRQRVDCLVLWYVDPGRSHPRLLERFYPRGDADPAGGDRDRELVAVGPRAGSAGADAAFTVDRSDSLRLLWLVRLLADDPAAPERDDDPLGDAAAGLLERLRDATCGAWAWEAAGGLRGGPVEASGVLRLLETLGEDTPWGACPLRGAGNPAGAEAVLGWQSGYPAAVDYRSGHPRYGGGGREGPGDDVDVLLTVGPPPEPPAEGTEVVWIDTGAAGGSGSRGDGGDGEPGPGPAPDAAVRLPVLPPGVREGDTLLRTDGVSVRSPGLPGREAWDGEPAHEVLESVLAELARTRNEEDAS